MELNGITHLFNLEFVLDGPFLKHSPTLQLRHRKTEVNQTGLMWELAPSMGALLVFAEHRCEPKSHPNFCGVGSQNCVGLLKSCAEQNFVSVFFLFVYISSVISISCFLHVFVFVDSFQKEREEMLHCQHK